jgi:hypothetical protein
MRRLAHQHGIWIGQGLNTRREVHSIAEDRDLRLGPFLNLPDYRRSGD